MSLTSTLMEAASHKFRSQPFKHQPFGAQELVDYCFWLLAWDQGTGKSAVVCYALRAMAEAGLLEDAIVLIVCPVSVVNVWPEQIERHVGLDGFKVEVLRGSLPQRKKVLARVASRGREPVVLVTNYETLRGDVAAIEKLRPAVVVLDESHRIKNATAQTSKAAYKVGRWAKYRWCLSGTPTPNGLIDAYGQLKFLAMGDSEVPKGVTEFKNRYCILGGFENRQIVAYRDEDKLYGIVGRYSSSLKKEDCLDLPEKIYHDRRCELNAKARSVYNSLKAEAIASLESLETITATNVLAELTKLLQLAGGFVIDDAGEVNEVGRHKIDLLDEVLEDFGCGRGGKRAIVWCAYRAEVAALAKHLPGSAVVFGGIKATERQQTLDDFRAGRIQYLIATPATLREGVTLVECDTAIYYSRGFNLLDWLQSQDRIHRIGQDKSVNIVTLTCEHTLDQKVSRALESKRSLQDELLGAVHWKELLE